jgi:N-acetyl-gamma-glutamyl-phosphate reductase/acetylglutamate kinase
MAFVPNVAPWFSGIISVLTAPLDKSFRANEISELYAEKYGGERMCVLGKGVPDIRDAEGKHGWRMGGVQVHSSGKRVVVVVSAVERYSLARSSLVSIPIVDHEPV